MLTNQKSKFGLQIIISILKSSTINVLYVQIIISPGFHCYRNCFNGHLNNRDINNNINNTGPDKDRQSECGRHKTLKKCMTQDFERVTVGKWKIHDQNMPRVLQQEGGVNAINPFKRYLTRKIPNGNPCDISCILLCACCCTILSVSP